MSSIHFCSKWQSLKKCKSVINALFTQLAEFIGPLKEECKTFEKEFDSHFGEAQNIIFSELFSGSFRIEIKIQRLLLFWTIFLNLNVQIIYNSLMVLIFWKW